MCLYPSGVAIPQQCACTVAVWLYPWCATAVWLCPQQCACTLAVRLYPRSVTVPWQSPRALVPWQCPSLGACAPAGWRYPGGLSRSLYPRATPIPWQQTPLQVLEPGRFYTLPRLCTCPRCPRTPVERLHPDRVPVPWPNACSVKAPQQSACTPVMPSVRLCHGSAPVYQYNSRVAVSWQSSSAPVRLRSACTLAQCLQAPPTGLVPDPEKKEAALAVSSTLQP